MICFRGGWIPMRYVQLVLFFTLTSLTYAMRANMSVAIVAMLEKTSDNPEIPIYNWKLKSVILSSFYWGYFLLQIPGGLLSRKYGSKIIILISTAVCTLCCILTPIAATLGPYAIIACRVVQGSVQAFIFPSLTNLVGSWAPVSERSTISTITISGCVFGTILTTALVGFISASWVGWPGSFYIIGSTGFVWIALYYCLGSDSPSKHPFISENEKNYIESSGGQSNDLQISSTPWTAIFTSLPFWAIFIAVFGQSWSLSIIFLEMPTYMNKILKINIQSNGILSAVPYVASFVVGFLVGPLSDFLVNHKYMSLLSIRKLFSIMGLLGPAASLVILGYLPENNVSLVVMLFAFTEGLASLVFAGHVVNLIDLSPNYCGILIGITNTLENFCSLVTPLIIQYIITDEADQSQWRLVILASTVPLVVSALFYGTFASAKLQSWNSPTEKISSEYHPNTNKLTVSLPSNYLEQGSNLERDFISL